VSPNVLVFFILFQNSFLKGYSLNFKGLFEVFYFIMRCSTIVAATPFILATKAATILNYSNTPRAIMGQGNSSTIVQYLQHWF